MFGPSKREILRRSERREEAILQFARECLDRVADAKGTPWTPAPADSRTPPTAPSAVSWSASPEQEVA